MSSVEDLVLQTRDLHKIALTEGGGLGVRGALRSTWTKMALGA